MSNLAQGDDDYPEAAGKHLDDATALFAQNRFDGAAYLAGYGVECALKTLAVVSELSRTGLTLAALKGGAAPSAAVLTGALTYARNFKHSLHGLSQALLVLASLPGAATANYQPPKPLASMYPNGWSETLRYTAPRFGSVPVDAWIEHAEDVYRTTVAKLRLDGIVR